MYINKPLHNGTDSPYWVVSDPDPRLLELITKLDARLDQLQKENKELLKKLDEISDTIFKV